MHTGPLIESEFLNELPMFENFLQQIGLKRIEGSVYGLLVLCGQAISSEQIESTLGLSQSAVSNALKKLTHFGAVETIISREGRQRLHQAKEDGLEIAATMFRKREQKEIVDFRKMAERLLALSYQKGAHELHPRVIRLKSIIFTCQLAEAVMNFVIELVDLDLKEFYPELIQKFPKALELLTQGLVTAKKVGKNLSKDSLAFKFLGSLGKIANGPSKKQVQQ